MTIENTGVHEKEWQEARAKIEESDAYILILANETADFYRTTIVSGNKSNTAIFRAFLPSRENLGWTYNHDLADGEHRFHVTDLFRFEYVNGDGNTYFPSGEGEIFVTAENHADGSIMHRGILLNVRCERNSTEKVTINGTYLFHGFA